MKDYFTRLVLYNQWANQNLCKHLQAQPRELLEVMMKFSHLVAAEEIWYHRIHPLKFELLPLFEAQPWDILKPRMSDSAQRWLDLVENTPDYGLVINYQNTQGKSYRSSLSDILIHLANHGTYHRGQIATIMRQNGLEPMPSDYILMTRSDA